MNTAKMKVRNKSLTIKDVLSFALLGCITSGLVGSLIFNHSFYIAHKDWIQVFGAITAACAYSLYYKKQ